MKYQKWIFPWHFERTYVFRKGSPKKYETLPHWYFSDILLLPVKNNTVLKVSKYWVFSRPYNPVFRLNIEISLHKKWSFALRISSVNVTKSSKNCLLRVSLKGSVRKRGLKKSYLDTFHTVQDFAKVSIWYWISCFRLTGNRNEDFEIRQMALNEADKLKNEVSIMDILFYFFLKKIWSCCRKCWSRHCFFENYENEITQICRRGCTRVSQPDNSPGDTPARTDLRPVFLWWTLPQDTFPQPDNFPASHFPDGAPPTGNFWTKTFHRPDITPTTYFLDHYGFFSSFNYLVFFPNQCCLIEAIKMP